MLIDENVILPEFIFKKGRKWTEIFHVWEFFVEFSLRYRVEVDIAAPIPVPVSELRWDTKFLLFR